MLVCAGGRTAFSLPPPVRWQSYIRGIDFSSFLNSLSMAATQTATTTEANGTYRRGTKDKSETNGANVTASTPNAKTDYSRWRLKNERGCQTWHYLGTDEEAESWPQTMADKYFLGLDLVGH